MTKNGKCLWIVETLLRTDGLSLRELNDRWMQSSLCDDGRQLHERTFARYREFISSEYAIDIEYSPSTNKYFIENADEIRDNALYRYLLSAYRIADLNTMAIHHRNRLLLEPTPTGTQHLSPLLQAIDRGATVLFDYTSYYDVERLQHWELIPCFLRIFEGRWYLIAEYMDHSKAKVFALERISELRIGSNLMQPVRVTDAAVYYADCFGIIREDRAPSLVRLWADREQRCYLRAQPLHESQREVETADDHSLFEYWVRPSFDFYQKVLWMREKVCIVSPDSVRGEMAAIVGRMAAMYGAAPQGSGTR